MPPRERDTQAGRPCEDLKSLRDGIATHCKNFDADFESVNAIVTLKRTSAEFENFVTSYFKQYDLSPGRFNVLMSLFSSPNHTRSLSDLGDYLVVTRANITGLVDGLVEDGLLLRIDHPDDRRVVLAQLTEKAVKFLEWFAPLHLRNIKRLTECFSSEEKREFVVLLDKLRGHMQQLAPEKIESKAQAS
ncbi:MAG TPA: MarR family transcriptional regulator [Candidatus Eremiobacteraceae bacterium]|nr:MarR family transcriptional regulator [Candidatus Eremiobacteraceae bacterium]